MLQVPFILLNYPQVLEVMGKWTVRFTSAVYSFFIKMRCDNISNMQALVVFFSTVMRLLLGRVFAAPLGHISAGSQDIAHKPLHGSLGLCHECC